MQSHSFDLHHPFGPFEGMRPPMMAPVNFNTTIAQMVSNNNTPLEKSCNKKGGKCTCSAIYEGVR